MKNFEIKPDDHEQDHYGSVMFRVLVNYVNNDSTILEKHLIVKTMLVTADQKTSDEGARMFQTEINMYSQVIPQIQQSLQKIGDDTQITGKCYHATMNPEPILIFEDLTKNGYKSVGWGGDWETAKKAVDKLVKLHASSYKAFKDGNSGLEKFSANFFTSDFFTKVPMFQYSFQCFLEILKETPELEQFVPKFENIVANNPLVKGQNVINAYFRGTEINILVLNHGDFHIKNIMFTENNGATEDVLLIDFQCCVLGPAAIDIIYMLYMFLNDDDRLNRRDEIINYYFSNLTKALEDIGFSGTLPTLNQLYEDLLKFKDFGMLFFEFQLKNLIKFYLISELMIAVSMLPFITALQGDAPITNAGAVMFNVDLTKKCLYKNPRYLEYLKKALPVFLQKGLLD